MAFELTPLWDEVVQIMNGPITFNNRRWDAIIHLVDAKIDLIPVRVTHVNTRRKYNQNYTDEVFMECYMPIGDYADIFYPNKLNLEITMIASPLNYVRGGPPKSLRFKAVVLDAGQPRMISGDMNGTNTKQLNLTDIVRLEFQLMPKVIYTLRTASVGAIFRQSTSGDAIKTLITSETSRIEGDASEKITGVDMVEPDNQDVKEQLVVPHGTMLYDVPQFFQKKMYGLYRQGMAHYIQNNTWYIYPTYDINRNDKNDRLLKIIVVPKNKFPSVNKTYRKTGDYSYTIIATAEGAYRNPTKEVTMNEGTGSRYMNADSLLSYKGKEQKDNKVTLEKPVYLSEITDTIPQDGETFAPFSGNPITSNSFEEQSKLAGRSGAHITFKWENSFPDAIVPGMLAKVVYLTVDNQIVEIKGIILECEHFEALTQENLVEDTYATNTALHLYCENDLLDNTNKMPRFKDDLGVKGEPQFLFKRN